MENNHEQETEAYTIPACSPSQAVIDRDRENDAKEGLVHRTLSEYWDSFRHDSFIDTEFDIYALSDADLSTPIPRDPDEDDEDDDVNGDSEDDANKRLSYDSFIYDTLGMDAGDHFCMSMDVLLDAAENAGTFGDYIFSVSEILAAKYKSCRTALDLASARFYGTGGIKKDTAIAEAWRQAATRWARELPPCDRDGNEKAILIPVFEWVVRRLNERLNPSGGGEPESRWAYAGKEAAMPLKVLGLRETDIIQAIGRAFEAIAWDLEDFGAYEPSLEESDIDLNQSLGEQFLHIFEIYVTQTLDPRMAIALAQAYTYGYIGGIRDTAKAVRWYETAASQGSRNAMTRAGLAYLRSLPVNIYKALQWIFNARHAGDEMAAELLGFMLKIGDADVSFEKVLMTFGAKQSLDMLVKVSYALELYFDPAHNMTFAADEDRQIWHDWVERLKT